MFELAVHYSQLRESFTMLEATGSLKRFFWGWYGCFSGGGGLGMGVSDVGSCDEKYLRIEGGKKVSEHKQLLFALRKSTRPTKRGGGRPTSGSVIDADLCGSCALTVTPRTTGMPPPRADGASTTTQTFWMRNQRCDFARPRNFAERDLELSHGAVRVWQGSETPCRAPPRASAPAPSMARTLDTSSTKKQTDGEGGCRLVTEADIGTYGDSRQQTADSRQQTSNSPHLLVHPVV
eukprot:3254775-Rhodomonas_salina.1